MSFRKIVFWLHLGAGIVAGLVIALMSLTGVLIAFQPQILDGMRAELRRLEIPEGAERLPLERLVERAEAARDGAKATGVSLFPEPESAVVVRFGRSDQQYVHPTSGELLADPGEGAARFFRSMTILHRWLGASGDNRELGKAITGASNALFVFLGVSGLYLWMPRRWIWRAIRPVLLFRRGLRGKALDFNLHHVIGIWTVPALLVLAGSALVISYPALGRLLYSATGERPPVVRGYAPLPKIELPDPVPNAQRLALDAFVTKARAALPDAEELTFAITKPNEPLQVSARLRDTTKPASLASLAFDPYSGELLHVARFENQALATRIRGWLRFLHTGEALGLGGQVVAAVASMGGVVLAYTGIALSLRRLMAYRRRKERLAKPETKGLDPIGF